MKVAESRVQQEAVLWFRNNFCLKHHSPRCIIYSVPNESEDSWDIQKKINTGLMSGAADLVVLLPGGHVLLPETKTPIGYQSPSQKLFQLQCEELGHIYFVYKSLEQFKELVTPYLIKSGVIKNG